MIKNLQTILGVNVDAQYQAGEELKRGDFVKVEGGKLMKAASVDEMVGVVVRDVKVTKDVAMGYPVSDWDAEQDTILKDEYCGLRVLHKGERFATDCLASADIDGEANKGAAGEYVIVENGKLKGTATQETDTGLKSLGKMNVAGHVMFGFVVTK